MASLKVNPGQKITAVHQNKVIDAICSLQTNNDIYGSTYQLDPFALQDIRIPAFELCWYQQNSANIVVYTNNQNQPDNIVLYNGENIPYKPFGYTVPGNSGSEGEIVAPSSMVDGLNNAIYQAICTIDLGCITNGCTLNLQIIEKTVDPCSETQTDLEQTSSQSDSQTNESETSATLVYTFANDEEIKKEWSKYQVIKSFPIGIYENYGFRQIHDGLLIYSEPSAICIGLNVDTDIAKANLSSIQFDKYVDPCTSAETNYITFFNSNNAFTSAGILERTDYPSGLSIDQALRTTFLYNEGSINKILKYGIPSQYYLLNDISGQESAAFVAPSSISTYKDLWIGCTKEPSANSATIFFENPFKIELVSSNLSSSDAGNVVSSDYIFTISASNNRYDNQVSAKGVWKAYRPYTLCLENDEGKEDYISSQLCTKNGQLEYIVLGPNLVLCQKGEKENGFEYDDKENQWTLNLSATSGSSGADISAGCYIRINDGYINGPSMCLELINNPECAQIWYNDVQHYWKFDLPKGSGTSLSAGCYIEINQDNYINGPQMRAKWATSTAKNPYFEYLEDGHQWLLSVPKLSGSSGVDLSAGQFIQINDDKIDGPCIYYSESCAKLNEPPVLINYESDKHAWNIAFWRPTREVSTGCYIQIGNCDGMCLIYGPELSGKMVSLACTEEPCFKYSENEHKWNIDLPSHVSAGCYLNYISGTIHAPAICLEYISRCTNICETGFVYNKSEEVTDNGIWNLKLYTPLSAGNYLCQQNATIRGPNMVVDESTSYDHPTFEYKAESHEWYLKTPPISGGSGGGGYVISGFENIGYNDGILSGAQIKLALEEGLTGAANYNSGTNTWILNIGIDYKNAVSGLIPYFDQRYKPICS